MDPIIIADHDTGYGAATDSENTTSVDTDAGAAMVRGIGTGEGTIAAASAGALDRMDGFFSVDLLRAGSCLRDDLIDHAGVLLLSKGRRITQRFLDLLRERRVRAVKIESAKRDRAADDLVARVRPSRERSCASGDSLAELGSLVRLAVEHHIDTARLLGGVFESVGDGKKVSGVGMACALDGLIEIIGRDSDVVGHLVSLPVASDEYLLSHGVHVATLSMSIAARLGWPRSQVVEVGLGALLHDAGMIRIPDHIRFAPRQLTHEERSIVQDHPYHTLNLMERISGLPTAVKLIAYQTHERGDRSGYPRRRSGMFLHPYSKVVGIADAYNAMAGQRPHREAMLPYEAARRIVYDAAARRFEPEFVRAFLDVISLFPLGSFVELDSGAFAQVVRSNSGQHASPVVKLVDGCGAHAGEVVDLARNPDVRIVHAVPSPHGVDGADIILP